MISVSRTQRSVFPPALACTALAIVLLAGPQVTRCHTAEKNKFHLFNPTPDAYLRPMTTDGPAATESPYTVDAGHFQIEMSFVDYTYYEDSFDGVTFLLEWTAVAPFNLRVGLLNQLDLQLVLEPYNHVFEREDGFYRVRRDGFGDTTVRLKYNLWGNDGGRTAAALTPYVKFPTSDDGIGSEKVEWGIIVPFSAELPWEFYLGLTTRFGLAEDIFDREGQHNEFGNSISFSRELIGNLEGYVEFFSLHTTEDEVGWIGTFNTGLIYWLTDNLQLNAGVDIGVSRWADDWNLFAGFAWRH